MSTGVVSLVGAGPGDPGLITVKGLRCLERADVIVYDRLVDGRLLVHAQAGAELVDVGKETGKGRGKQAIINELLIDRARKGKRVVRLKGGDPFVFGRGAEEACVLSAEGIAFEVVPGVSSAIAAPAYAGIPLTHRQMASSFTVATGSESSGKDASSVNWQILALEEGTLVVLMGWENLDSLVRTLVDHGRPPDTPIALVRWGTLPYQQTVVGTLQDIVSRASKEGFAPPVVAIIGDVVRLREKLRWFDTLPLFGLRVLITRTHSQAEGLSTLLFERGAHPIELPTIEVRPLEDYNDLDESLGRLGSYDWVVFTSTNAVSIVFKRLGQIGLDSRNFGKARVGAIGPATAESLKRHGIAADLVPNEYTSDGLVCSLQSLDIKDARILLPRADIAPKKLKRALSNIGGIVDEITAYQTVTPDHSQIRVEEILSNEIDVVAFTSSSTVTGLAQVLDGNLHRISGAAVACIGPVTASTAREMGFKVDIVAEDHTALGLVGGLEAYFATEGSHE